MLIPTALRPSSSLDHPPPKTLFWSDLWRSWKMPRRHLKSQVEDRLTEEWQPLLCPYPCLCERLPCKSYMASKVDEEIRFEASAAYKHNRKSEQSQFNQSLHTHYHEGRSSSIQDKSLWNPKACILSIPLTFAKERTMSCNTGKNRLKPKLIPNTVLLLHRPTKLQHELGLYYFLKLSKMENNSSVSRKTQMGLIATNIATIASNPTQSGPLSSFETLMKVSQ